MNLRILAFLLFCSGFARAQNFNWVSHIGSATGHESVSALSVSSQDSVIYGVSFTDTLNINGSKSTAAGGKDVLLHSLDSNGAAAWNNPIHFSSNGASDAVSDIAYYAFGSSHYVTGWLDDTTRVGAITNVYAKGGTFFLSKIRINGAIDWVIPDTNLSVSKGKSVATDNSGNVYLLGEYVNTLVLNKSPLVTYQDSGLGDVFVAKYNSSGVFLWSKRIYGAQKIEGIAIRYNVSSNEVIVAGNFMNNVYFDNSSSFLSSATANKKDVFMVRCNASTGAMGTPLRIISSTDHVEAFDMAVDASGGVALTGGFFTNYSAGSFNRTSNGLQDIFVVKVNASNAVVSALQYGGTNSESGKKVLISSNNIVITYGAYKSSNINFSGKIISTSSTQDAFLLATDFSGAQFGAKGGLMSLPTDIMNTYALALTNQKAYISGDFKGRAKFGTTDTLTSMSFSFYDGYLSQVKSSSIYCTFNDTLVTSNFRSLASNNFICVGDTGTITSKATSPYTFQWFKNGSAITGATSNNLSVVDSGKYHLKLTLPALNCSEATKDIRVKLDSLPIVEITADTFCIAAGFHPILLKPSYSISNSTISSTAGGVVGFPPNFQPTSAGIGVDTVTYTYKNIFTGCEATDVGYFKVNANPVITVNNVKSYCNNDGPDTLRFQTPVRFPINKYSMTPAVGIVNDSIFYPSRVNATTHAISYEVTDTNGCKVQTNVNVTVNPVPNVGFMISPNRLCRNAVPVNLTGAFPTGGVFSGRGIAHGTSGKYIADSVPKSMFRDTLKYTVTNGFGCVADTVQYMTIDTVPVVSQTIPTGICESDSIIILSSGKPVVFYFNESSGYTGSPFLSSNDEFFPRQAGPGKHEANYWFKNKLGCSDTTRGDSITVHANPVVTIVPHPGESGFGSYCENGAAVTFNQAQPAGGTYYFQGKPLVNGVFNPYASNVNVGIDSVNYVYTDANGCVGKAGDEVKVKSKPNIIYPSLSFSPVCNNSKPIDIIAMGDTLLSPPPSKGGWFTFDTIVRLTTINPADYVPPTSYEAVSKELFYIYVDTGTSCGDTASQYFTVNPAPEVEITGRKDACDGIASSLTADGGIIYVWSTGDTAKSITFVQSEATIYKVTITNFSGCLDSTAYEVTMTQGNYFKAKPDSTTLQKGQDTYLDVLARNFPSDTIDIIGEFRVLTLPYEAEVWREDMGISGKHNSNFYYKPNIDFRRIDSVQYKMCDATCVNICDSAWVKFRVLGDPYEFLPNGFSPNGDGINDTWQVPGIELYPDNELFIYNRWGDLIFSAAPYANDWDGQPSTGLRIGGSNAVDGTYFYVLKMGESEPIKGTIELKSK
ncbi:MAG: gliding motility-associated C-terminal domain-containing protein [Flavobacteriales bacterium]|nr:gliding motility-associated C-terminal domain-containing protein [Flavobacteriales bacterium]